MLFTAGTKIFHAINSTANWTLLQSDNERLQC